jgi:hypothetical protein
MMMLLSAVLAAVKMICSTGNAGGNRKQKKRQSAQLRKLTLCNVKL